MLVLLGFIGSIAFLAEIETMIFILMCIVNINALVWYCRNAGNPYRTEKYKKYLHKFKFVVVYWNFALIAKLIFSNVGVNITDFDGTSDDPDVDEPLTHHEGLPPDVGVKYAANVWVHNYDYRTPSDAGCPMAFKNTH